MRLKSDIIFFASYIFMCIGIPFSDVSIQNFSLLMIFKHYMVIGIVFLLICNFIFLVFHLVQSINYKIMGFGSSPILCYPFIFGANRKKPIQIFWNFFYMAEVLYPKKLVIKTAQEYDESKISEISKKAQMSGLIAQICTCVITFCILAAMKKNFIALAFFVLGMAFLVLAFNDTETYQGIVTIRKYVEKGYLSIYLARQVILYENGEHAVYEKFEDKISKEIPPNLLKTCMETTRHMYMIKCENPDFRFLQENIVEIVEKKFLIHNMEDFQNLEYSAEGFDLLKVYLCYAILNNETSSYRVALHILEKLSEKERRNTLIHFDTFYWYYYMAKNYKMLKQKFFKNKVLRPNNFFINFENYKRNYDNISLRMNILCNIDDYSLGKNN